MPPLMASSRGPLHRLETWAAVLAIVVCAGRASPASAQGEGDDVFTLHYESRRSVSDGLGDFEGRDEAWLASGTIDVTRGAAGQSARHASITARERAQGGVCTFATSSTSFELDLEGPVHRASLTADDGTEHRVPFGGVLHVPPTTANEGIVPLRDHEYVATRGIVLEIGNQSVPVILLEASGREEITREEHTLVGHWSDSYWFDERTGWVLRREQTEIVEANDDGYEQRELTWVTDAPFLAPDARSVVLEVHDCTDPRAVRSSPWLRVGVPVALVIASVVAFSALRKRLAGEGT